MAMLWRISLLVLGMTTLGCDPGMTVRRATPHDHAENAALVVSVPTSHHLIGELNYSPVGVEATNTSKSPIKVVNLELLSHGKTYAYEQVGPVNYPITIKPGSSAKLPVWFDLHPSYLSAVFSNSVELRVYYELEGAKGFASAILVGVPLGDGT